ncbi:hypothetical protein P3L10_021507 [Capsicum annuum]
MAQMAWLCGGERREGRTEGLRRRRRGRRRLVALFIGVVIVVGRRRHDRTWLGAGVDGGGKRRAAAAPWLALLVRSLAGDGDVGRGLLTASWWLEERG